MLIGKLAQWLAAEGARSQPNIRELLLRILSFLHRSGANVKGVGSSGAKLTALTSRSLIYNICGVFDERLQQQTIAAAAAGAISQRYLAKCGHWSSTAAAVPPV